MTRCVVTSPPSTRAALWGNTISVNSMMWPRSTVDRVVGAVAPPPPKNDQVVPSPNGAAALQAKRKARSRTRHKAQRPSPAVFAAPNLTFLRGWREYYS